MVTLYGRARWWINGTEESTVRRAKGMGLSEDSSDRSSAYLWRTCGVEQGMFARGDRSQMHAAEMERTVKKMKWRLWIATIGLIGLSMACWGQGSKGTGGRLKVYFVDVEGGQATLFLKP